MELYNRIEEDVIYNGFIPFIQGVILTKKRKDRYESYQYVFDSARFVFSEVDIKKIKSYLMKYRCMNIEDISFVIRELEKSNYEYYNGSESSSYIYIKVDDCDKFFCLLYQIYEMYLKTQLSSIHTLINERVLNLWLRIGIEDVDDVIGFLKKELAFARNWSKLGNFPVQFDVYNGLEIYYENRRNDSQFETNSHILFSFKTKFQCTDDADYDEVMKAIDNVKTFELPVVHYGLKKDGEVPTCYLYGIQNLSNLQNRELFSELKELRNSLFNSNVSPFFIISLKLFVDLLAKKGIYTIKVPLMQVFNYEFHEFLGNSAEFNLKKYLNSGEDDGRCYEHAQRQYERFYGKEDVISFNKTERLIYTFMEMEDKFKNIEILNEPFIGGEYLIIKIKPREKFMSHFEGLQVKKNKTM